MTIAGQCRCGAVRYELALEAPPKTYACHCHECQRWSGSAFSLQALVPENVLTIEGPITLYEKTTEDRTSTQRLCAVCHTRIYNSNTRRPGLAVLRAGTLDRSEEVDCVAHIFIDCRQRWFALPEGVANWPEMPDLVAVAALLQL